MREEDGAGTANGDCIVARSGLSERCGLLALKADLPGSRVRDWDEFGPEVLAKSRPSLVVFALGINDAKASFRTDPDEWSRLYARLIDSASPAKVALLSIVPFERGQLRKGSIAPEQIMRLNAMLAELAAAKGALLLPPLSSTDGLTVDGVHLNETGQQQWNGRLAKACVALR